MCFRRAWGGSFSYSLLSCALLWGNIVQAAEPVASIATLNGGVSVQRSGTGTTQTISTQADLFAGDTLITGADGRATLLLSDESLVQMNRNTRLVLKSVDQSAGWLPTSVSGALQSVYKLLDGEIWFRNKNPETDLEIETPHVAIAVRGTEFVVRVNAEIFTEVDMLEGRIEASNPFGSIAAVSGEQVYAVPGAAPVKRLLLSPEDAVQWTVIVPQLLSPEAAAASGTSAKHADTISTVIEMLDNNRNTEARKTLNAALDEYPEDVYLNTTGAWLDLQDGQITQSVATLSAITTEHPDELFAWQAYSIALLADNQAEAALQSIQTARQLAPNDSNNYLIEAYVRQALLDFNSALASINTALELNPSNLTALVNTSQLYFGLGDIDKAQIYADRASAIDGTNSEVLNLTGYLNLARGNSSIAVARFAGAIRQSPGFSDPYLGLGLAQMRQGNEEEALESISTAVALDPTRSIYMSYWGRILYQLGRHERALQVLERAAELDPLDPTPRFLQALVYRDLNRYGQSIEMYNQAVALNENRAVYRSRFLLDQDQAVRNVDQSVIFQEFKFDGWSDRKAVSAVNDYFGNYTGHIMYANTLRNEGNRDIAALSENLQARLLKPSNVNSFNNFNQYTTFYDQPSLGGTLEAEYGSYDINNYKGTLFGALPEQGLAFEAGYVNSESDGWNDFNGDDTEQWSGVIKWDATFKDSFMFTASDLDQTLYDDLDGRFEYDDVPRPDYKIDADLQRYEFGYRHNFRAGMDLLVYAAYVDSQTDQTSDDVILDASGVAPSPPFPPDTNITNLTSRAADQSNDRDSWQYQAQMNILFDAHEVIFGGYYYKGDNDIELTVRESQYFFIEGGAPPATNPLPAFNVDIDNDEDRSFYSLYAQDTWAVTNWLDIEGALFYDQVRNSDPRFTDESWRIEKLNPRLGATFYAGDRDTFRISALRYFSPFISPLISPTEVAGLSVYNNNQEATLTKKANLGWDRNWDTGFFLLEGFWSKGEVEGREPLPLAGQLAYSGSTVSEDENRHIGTEMAVNQIIAERFGLVIAYLYLDAKDDLFPTSDRDEHDVEFELNFLGYSGVNIGIKHIFRSINFDNRSESGETINSTDASFSYLLPNKAAKFSLEGRNLMDNNFNWVTDRFDIYGVIPERNWRAKLEINF
jgi:tetratricopeptide (TPR) repeat protein